MTAAIAVGNGEWVVRGTLTNVDSTTFEELTGLPATGRLIRLYVQKTSGSGTVIEPYVDWTSSSISSRIIAEATGAADREPPESDTLVDEAGSASYSMIGQALTSIRFYPGVDAGNDNSISFEFHFLQSWD